MTKASSSWPFVPTDGARKRHIAQSGLQTRIATMFTSSRLRRSPTACGTTLCSLALTQRTPRGWKAAKACSTASGTRLVAEELKTSARISIERPIAPNGAEWRITERGATLQTIADLLSEANAVFETALGECPAPRLVGPTGRWRPRFSHSPA